MAIMKVVGKIVQITGMNVKGGKLPEGFETKLDVDLDFGSCSDTRILEFAGGGSSARVQLQSKLRELPTSKLRELAKAKFTVNAANLDLPASELFLSDEERLALLWAQLTPEQRAMLKKMK